MKDQDAIPQGQINPIFLHKLWVYDVCEDVLIWMHDCIWMNAYESQVKGWVKRWKWKGKFWGTTRSNGVRGRVIREVATNCREKWG